MTVPHLIALVTLASPQSGRCRFDVVAENSAIAPGRAFWVAGRFRIEPKWHIYWINPGESGLPTGLDWKLPPGFKLLETKWPVPKLLPSQGSVSYGYEGEVAVLAKVLPPATLRIGTRARVQANADWMACLEMCVTGDGAAAKDFVVAPRPRLDRAVAGAFARYRANVAESGTGLAAFVYEGNSRLRLEVKIPDFSNAKSMVFFPYKSGVTPASGEQVCSFAKTSLLVMPKAEGFRPSTLLEGVLSVTYLQNKRRAFIVNAPYKSP